MEDELQRIVTAYQRFYGLSLLAAIRAIRKDLSEMAMLLKPVKR